MTTAVANTTFWSFKSTAAAAFYTEIKLFK